MITVSSLSRVYDSILDNTGLKSCFPKDIGVLWFLHGEAILRIEKFSRRNYKNSKKLQKQEQGVIDGAK